MTGVLHRIPVLPAPDSGAVEANFVDLLHRIPVTFITLPRGAGIYDCFNRGGVGECIAKVERNRPGSSSAKSRQEREANGVITGTLGEEVGNPMTTTRSQQRLRSITLARALVSPFRGCKYRIAEWVAEDFSGVSTRVKHQVSQMISFENGGAHGWHW